MTEIVLLLEKLKKVWTMKDDKYYQVVLMLLRISELLDLRKENVHLEEQYFDVIDSKTENGIRKVPIADKVLQFYKNRYIDYTDPKYLLHTVKSFPIAIAMTATSGLS